MDVVTNYVDILIYAKVSFVVNAHSLLMQGDKFLQMIIKKKTFA